MTDVINIGSRRELMLDDFLIDRLDGAIHHRLHTPVPREVALVTDRPWEGQMCNYVSVLHDPVAGLYRMYYNIRSIYDQVDPERDFRQFSVGIAISRDGIGWERIYPNLYPGWNDEKTSIIFRAEDIAGAGTHGFSPFFDTSPDAKPDEWFKAVGADNGSPPVGIYLATSPDGVRWKRKSDQPIFTSAHSKRMRFDSHNAMFWDTTIGQYRLYFRDYDDNETRGIRTATSPDLAQWSEPQWLDYGSDAPVAALYTNNVVAYQRAPHHLLGFPMRYTARDWSPTIEALPELEHRQLRARLNAGSRCGTSLTDGLFMSSRDGVRFKRWDEAFIRPGPAETGNWAYADNNMARGMIETDSAEPGGGKELSLFAQENFWRQSRFRRHTLRIDGFVSLCAAYRGGTMVTRPFIFEGSRLSLNVATSAAGRLRVAIQDAAGAALPGYALDDCYDIVGDTLDYTVNWKSGRSVERLSGQTIRLRIELCDADLYAIQFTQ